jgi:hypothetical protein
MRPIPGGHVVLAGLESRDERPGSQGMACLHRRTTKAWNQWWKPKLSGDGKGLGYKPLCGEILNRSPVGRMGPIKR